MCKKFLIVFSIAVIFLLPSFAQSAENTQAGEYSKFSEYDEYSELEFDFSIVDQLLHAGVLNMGPSTRSYARKPIATLGTRLTQTIDGATENEANRFFYENLKKEQAKILKLRKELEAVPSVTPLNQYTREAQLAYWLNLYTVTLINELALIYPLNNLKPVLTGDESLLDKKVLVVDNTSLSLNDIHYGVLPALYPDNKLYIYGLHQGIKGSPNVRNKAYTGKDVKQILKDNAQEFVNSNRGTQFNGGDGVVRVSSFYERHAALFPNFDKDMQAHLLQFADESIIDAVQDASRFEADIDNWRINDIYGSIRRRDSGILIQSGGGNRLADGNKLSQEQRQQMASLMRVRARNFGEATVTVTDLDNITEPEAQSDENTQ